jgi:hypothetical protein
VVDLMRFTEIEHKFVVDHRFDLAAFGRALDALGPSRRTSLQVRDRYFLTRDGRAEHYILRHRFDAELHELTVKSLAPDPEVRDEITLDLSRRDGDQAAEVDAFVARLGVTWSGVLQKDLDVWYFPDCEVVHYVASSLARTVRCVEFEATRNASLAEALAIIGRYERATGLEGATRSVRSIVELLFPEVPWPLTPPRNIP